MQRNLAFRAWFYFRNGWSTYFAFIFAAINTLTVTYFLAIERAPSLQAIFPSFLMGFGDINPGLASFYGGTSLLIIVGVALDTLQQIESHLLMRHYLSLIHI